MCLFMDFIVPQFTHNFLTLDCSDGLVNCFQYHVVPVSQHHGISESLQVITLKGFHLIIINIWIISLRHSCTKTLHIVIWPFSGSVITVSVDIPYGGYTFLITPKIKIAVEINHFKDKSHLLCNCLYKEWFISCLHPQSRHKRLRNHENPQRHW